MITNRQTLFSLLFSLVVLALIFGLAAYKSKAQIDIQFQGPQLTPCSGTYNLSGWLWSSNIGWISMNCNDPGAYSSINYGVDINQSGNFVGYGWSSNIGWVQFSPSLTGPAGTYSNYGAKLTGTSVSGWAKAVAGGTAGSGGWDGWISLRNKVDIGGGGQQGAVALAQTNAYGVSLSGTTLSGYAWGSDVIGWIYFNNVTYDAGIVCPDGTQPPCKVIPVCLDGTPPPCKVIPVCLDGTPPPCKIPPVTTVCIDGSPPPCTGTSTNPTGVKPACPVGLTCLPADPDDPNYPEGPTDPDVNTIGLTASPTQVFSSYPYTDLTWVLTSTSKPLAFETCYRFGSSGSSWSGLVPDVPPLFKSKSGVLVSSSPTIFKIRCFTSPDSGGKASNVARATVTVKPVLLEPNGPVKPPEPPEPPKPIFEEF